MSEQAMSEDEVHISHPKRLMVAATIVFLLLLLNYLLPTTGFATPEVEEGFTINLVTEGLGGPTCLVWVNSGTLLVCDRDGGRLLYFFFDYGTIGWDWEPIDSYSGVLLDGLDQPHDIHLGEDYIIVSEAGRLTRLNHSGPDTMWMDSVRNSEPWVLVEGVPTGNHQTNAINALANGTLVWHVGSTCNICDELDERNAALLWVDPDSGEHGVLASGVRNSFDGVWLDGVGYLFSDNGRDWEGDHPPEEMNLLSEGADYGWPDDDPDHPVPSGTVGPIGTWTSHSSLNGLAVRPSDSSFPGGEFTVYGTVFGSWNSVTPVGHEIVRMDFLENSSAAQGWETNITSFAQDLGTPLPIAFHPSGDYLFYATFSGGGSLHVISMTEDARPVD
jgi:glucose/arabinose dehydrogenase